MKTDNQRREFEFALETLLKACDSKVKSVIVNWDEKDTVSRVCRVGNNHIQQ